WRSAAHFYIAGLHRVASSSQPIMGWPAKNYEIKKRNQITNNEPVPSPNSHQASIRQARELTSRYLSLHRPPRLDGRLRFKEVDPGSSEAKKRNCGISPNCHGS